MEKLVRIGQLYGFYSKRLKHCYRWHLIIPVLIHLLCWASNFCSHCCSSSFSAICSPPAYTIYIEVVQMLNLLEEHERIPSASGKVVLFAHWWYHVWDLSSTFPMLAHNHNHVGMFWCQEALTMWLVIFTGINFLQKSQISGFNSCSTTSNSATE